MESSKEDKHIYTIQIFNISTNRLSYHYKYLYVRNITTNIHNTNFQSLKDNDLFFKYMLLLLLAIPHDSSSSPSLEEPSE